MTFVTSITSRDNRTFSDSQPGIHDILESVNVRRQDTSCGGEWAGQEEDSLGYREVQLGSRQLINFLQ